MKATIQIIGGLLLLLGLVSACEHNTEPTLDLRTLGPPRVTSFAVPGIPSENIRIDTASKTVFVTVPTNVTTTHFNANIEVTPGYRLNESQRNGQYPLDLCAYLSTVDIYDLSGKLARNYRVVRKPAADMVITASPTPLTYETGGQIILPVSNYYDDAYLSNVVLTNKATGEKLTGHAQCCLTGTCDPAKPNQVVVTFDSSIPLGDYTLEIQKENGRKASTSQTFTVKRGTPTIGFDYYFPPTPGQQNVRLFGANLYQTDNFELLLTNRSGTEYRIKPKSYADNGQALFIDVPGDIKPDNYLIQLIQNGQAINAYSRFVVVPNADQPALQTLSGPSGSVLPNGPLSQPISLVRGQSYRFIFAPIRQGTVALKLTPTTSGQAVTIPATVPNGYFLGGPDGGSPTFSIPTAVPVGRYQLSLQFTSQAGQTTESAPLERDIDVK